jgi:asparagine synthase (glutamine-hydrolysing)
MCGIAGLSWPDASSIERMTEALAHRGPDDRGVRVADGVSLGHRRLSILDLSRAGRNPLPNEDRTVWVLHNGEVYNYRELRKALEERGHAFRSHTDTEVIVHAYEEWGDDCVERLTGMYAFCVWDAPRRRLLLVRDRLGIKPLYYLVRDGRLAFASEIKALLECPLAERAVDRQALFHYLGYEFVPGPRTMFAGIRKLPPGHRLVLELGREPRVERYWDVSFEPKTGLTRPEAEAHLRELLGRVVERHLQSDVPLGVFLSGGLDSSTLVALMAERSETPIPSFTIAYPDASFSEVPYAEIVAKRFRLDHRLLTIEGLTPATLQRAVWHLDEPMTDLSTVPFYLICEQARRHATVAVSGEGGDESLAGYDRFVASRIERALRVVPLALRRRLVHPFVHALSDRPEKKGAVNLLKRFVEGCELPPDGGAMRWQYFLRPEHVEPLFAPDLLAEVERAPFAPMHPATARCDARHPLDREIYEDLAFTLPDSVLMKVDKMSMAHALEVRVPFLDHEFVEFLAALPPSWKLRRLETKAILRTALADLLPPEILRRGKQGYSLPVKNWLREDMRGFLVDCLERSVLIREHLRIDFVRRLVEEHMALRANHNHVLWALLNASLWHERFVEERSRPEAAEAAS